MKFSHITEVAWRLHTGLLRMPKISFLSKSSYTIYKVNDINNKWNFENILLIQWGCTLRDHFVKKIKVIPHIYGQQLHMAAPNLRKSYMLSS